jgi:hypothetical protein
MVTATIMSLKLTAVLGMNEPSEMRRRYGGDTAEIRRGYGGDAAEMREATPVLYPVELRPHYLKWATA